MGQEIITSKLKRIEKETAYQQRGGTLYAKFI
jgi:hypothetical protein